MSASAPLAAPPSLATASAAAAAGNSPDQVADLLQEVAPLVTRWLRGEMRRASAGSLTVPQLRALSYVRRNAGTNLSALAEHLGVGMTTASGLVDRLVRQELVTRVQDPAERRRVRLELTAVGDARVQSSRAQTRDALTILLEGLSAGQLVRLRLALGDLRGMFQSPAAMRAPQPPTTTASAASAAPPHATPPAPTTAATRPAATTAAGESA